MARQSSKVQLPSEREKKTVLPSERADEMLNKAAEAAKREARLREVLNLTFKTPEGKEALAYIMHLCGYQTSSAVLNPATLELNVQSMAWNEARRELYVNHLRRFLDRELLREIEIQ
jgi:hypothetical protein